MRRSFDGLSMMAEHIIGCNPFSGHLLVFSNRRRCALQDRKTCPLSGSHNNRSHTSP